jgi:hypothetical protein
MTQKRFQKISRYFCKAKYDSEWPSSPFSPFSYEDCQPSDSGETGSLGSQRATLKEYIIEKKEEQRDPCATKESFLWWNSPCIWMIDLGLLGGTDRADLDVEVVLQVGEGILI